MEAVSYIEEVLSGSAATLLQDESALDFDYAPPSLPHREEHVKRLTQTYRGILDRPGSASLKALVFGGTGVGKTVVTKYFGENITRIARHRNLKLRFVYINCRTMESRWSLALNVAKRVNYRELNIKGYSPNQMFREVYDYLNTNDEYLLLALDEVDSFIKRTGENLIYDVMRLSEEYLNVPKRVAVILIARGHEIFDLPVLDRSTVSSLSGADIIELPPYKAVELRDILNQRIAAAFKPSVVPNEVVNFIADIAGRQGDARYAIELLWLAGKYADSEQARWVTPDHVRRARAQTHPWVRKDELEALSINEKTILLAVTRSYEAEDAYVTLNQVKAAYKVCCEELGLKPLGSAQLQGVLTELDKAGLVAVKRWRKKFLVGLPNVPPSLFKRELEVSLNGSLGRDAENKKR